MTAYVRSWTVGGWFARMGEIEMQLPTVVFMSVCRLGLRLANDNYSARSTILALARSKIIA